MTHIKFGQHRDSFERKQLIKDIKNAINLQEDVPRQMILTEASTNQFDLSHKMNQESQFEPNIYNN